MKRIKKNALRHLSEFLCITILSSAFLFNIRVNADIIPANSCELPANDVTGSIIYTQSDFGKEEFDFVQAGKVDEFFSPTDELWSILNTDVSHGASMQIGRNGYWTLSDAKQKNGKDIVGSVHEVSFDFKNTNYGHIYFYFCTVGNNRLNKGGLRISDNALQSVQDYGYTSYGSISSNKWYNIKFTYDTETDMAYVSVDGVVVDSYKAGFGGEFCSILYQRNDGTQALVDNITYTVKNNKFNYGVIKLTGTPETKYQSDVRWMAKEAETLCLIICAYEDDSLHKMTSVSYEYFDVVAGENTFSYTHTDKDSNYAKAFLWRATDKYIVPVINSVGLDNSLIIDSKLPLELTFDDTDDTSYAGCDIVQYESSDALLVNASTVGSIIFDAFVVGDYVISFDIASKATFSGTLTVQGGGSPSYVLEFDESGKINTAKGDFVSGYNSEYTTITLVYDADSYFFDIYADETLKIGKYFPGGGMTDKCVTFTLNFDSTSDSQVYIDNILAYPTYMQTSKCFIYDPWASPAPETKAVILSDENWFSDDTNEIEFMKDKVSLHKRSGVVCADGKKTILSHMPYEKNEEIMVPDEFFKIAYGFEIRREKNAIYVGDNIRLTLGANTMKVGNVNYGLSTTPEEKDGVLYLPLMSVMQKGLSQKIYSGFDTVNSGLMIFSLKKVNMPTGKSLQKLNDYCFYVRPTKEQWLNDYNNSPLKGVHPRVMATSEDFERLRNEIETDSTKKKWFNKLISYCNLQKNKAPLKYELRDGVRLMYVSDDFMHWITSYAFAYRITGDKTYFNTAWKHIESVSEMPDWNPVHHIDVGIMALGYAIAYDWFYDIMTEEQRHIMEKCIYNNMYWIVNEAHKSLDTPYGDPGMDDNHNVYCNAGVIASVIAFMDVYPEIGSHIAANTMRLLERFMCLFAPYGAYFEGPSYASISINYATRLFASMEPCMGTLYGMDKAEAFDMSGQYIMNMQSDVASFGFGDGDSNLKECPGIFWLYDHYEVKGRHRELADVLYGSNGADLVFALMFYDIEDNDEFESDVPLDFYYPGEDIIVTRNKFSQGQVFAGLKLGGTLHSHSHLDFGSFVYDANGKRWAHDLGADDYNLEYEWGFYDIFRRRPESHNTLLINPDSSYGFDINGRAKMISYEFNSDGIIAKTDMTELYGNKVKSAKRGFFFTDDRTSLVVRDEVTLNGDSDLYWLMYIDSNMEYVGNNTVVLTDKRYSNKKLRVEFLTSEEETTIGTESAVPFSDSPQIPNQNKNFGFKRLYYKVAGSGDVNITVKITPYDVEGSDINNYDTSMDNWSFEK